MFTWDLELVKLKHNLMQILEAVYSLAQRNKGPLLRATVYINIILIPLAGS